MKDLIVNFTDVSFIFDYDKKVDKVCMDVKSGGKNNNCSFEMTREELKDLKLYIDVMQDYIEQIKE